MLLLSSVHVVLCVGCKCCLTKLPGAPYILCRAGVYITHFLMPFAGYLDALGTAMISACQAIPNGVLCFFPSWGLLNAARDQWLVTGAANLSTHCIHRGQLWYLQCNKTTLAYWSLLICLSQVKEVRRQAALCCLSVSGLSQVKQMHQQAVLCCLSLSGSSKEQPSAVCHRSSQCVGKVYCVI